MTTEAGYAAVVHEALDEVIALHAILVCCAVGKMGEGGFTKFVLFEFPEVVEIQAYMEADRPIVVLAIDRVRQRPSLRMALDAGIVGMHVVEPRRVDDGLAYRIFHVLAAGSVTTFTADIPLGRGLGVDIIVHRVAAIA